jgi:hypothetical protein
VAKLSAPRDRPRLERGQEEKNGAKPAPTDAWEVARRRYRLSERHVAMARELGLNPRKLGSLDNHRQEPWKAPLRQFIEELHAKRFGRR